MGHQTVEAERVEAVPEVGSVMRRNTEFARYNRAQAFRVRTVNEPPSVLDNLALMESRLLYLMVKWSGCYAEKEAD